MHIGKWLGVPYAILLVVQCRVDLFLCLYIEMFCDCGNLPLPVDTPQSHLNQNLKRESHRQEVWVILLLHEVQRRGGSCPQMSCLRSEQVLSIANFITRELINPGVCCILVFFSKETCLKICVAAAAAAVVLSLSELCLCFILGHSFTPALSFYSDCMYTLWWDMTGCSCLLRVSYTCHSELGHRNLFFSV
jgi:hypothetical protein